MSAAQLGELRALLDEFDVVRVRLDAGDAQDVLFSVRPNVELPLNGDSPPSEFRLFRAGDNPTTKGTFKFTDKSARLVWADYVARGIRRSGDYNHNSLKANPSDEEGKASCRYDLEIRDGDGGKELWATNVQWTARADKYLRDKEYFQFSPAFDADKNTGEILRYVNLALTNDPATLAQPPLVAANDSAPSDGAPVETPAPSRTDDQPGAVAPKDKDTTMAKTRLGDFIEKKMAEGKIDEKALRAALGMDEQEMRSLMESEDLPQKMRRKLSALAAPLKCSTSRLRSLADGDDDEMKKMDEEEGEREKMRAKLAEREEECGKLRAKLSEMAKPTEEKEKLSALGAEVVRLSGRATPAEASAFIRGKVDAADSVSALSARVETAEAKLRDAERREKLSAFDDAIASAQRAGKLTPAEVKDETKGAGKYLAALRSSCDTVALSAYVEALPVKVQPGGGPVEERPDTVDLVNVKLSAEEQQFATQMGLSPERALEAKREQLRAKQARLQTA